MHTYNNTNHIITYHTYITFGPLPRFAPRSGARAGFNWIFATRVCLPVRTLVLTNAFRAAALYVKFGESPRVDSASLHNRGFVFGALAAETTQNGPFFGAAAKKDIASEARNAPAPDGPGASQTLCFVFVINDLHIGSASRKKSKSYSVQKCVNGVWL